MKNKIVLMKPCFNPFIKALTGLVAATALVFLCSNCTSKERSKQTILQGTWKGMALCNRVIEYKAYAPMLEDSLTKIKDSVYSIQDVLLDLGKNEARFFGVHSITSVAQTYSQNANTLLFEKKPVRNGTPDTTSGSIVAYPVTDPLYGEIIKLDADSLVMRLTGNDAIWGVTVLKLKRQVK